MRSYFTRLLFASLIIATASPAFADRDHRRERREDRREERRDDRQDRRERREERREDRFERREDRRERRADRAPPAVRVERWKPRRGYTWVEGNWAWNGGDWVWTTGRYERERRGQRWRPHRYEQRDGAYVVVDGGWVTMGPTAAPPTLREERYDTRAGYVWVRGSWDWRGDQWVWTQGHYERERANARWRDRRWEQRDGVYISVDGGWDIR